MLAARGSTQPARLLVIEAAYSEFVAYLRILDKGCRCDNDPLTSHCRLGYHTSQPVTGLFSSSSSLHRTVASSPTRPTKSTCSRAHFADTHKRLPGPRFDSNITQRAYSDMVKALTYRNPGFVTTIATPPNCC